MPIFCGNAVKVFFNHAFELLDAIDIDEDLVGDVERLRAGGAAMRKTY